MPRLTEVLLAIISLGAPSSPVAHPRVYDLQVNIPGKAFAGTLAVDVDASPPTASLHFGSQEARILSAKGTADSLDVLTSQDGDLFAYRLKFEGENIRGTVLYNGGALTGTVTGQRQR